MTTGAGTSTFGAGCSSTPNDSMGPCLRHPQTHSKASRPDSCCPVAAWSFPHPGHVHFTAPEVARWYFMAYTVPVVSDVPPKLRSATMTMASLMPWPS